MMTDNIGDMKIHEVNNKWVKISDLTLTDLQGSYSLYTTKSSRHSFKFTVKTSAKLRALAYTLTGVLLILPEVSALIIIESEKQLLGTLPLDEDHFRE